MHIRVLGPLEAFANGTDVTPSSPNQRTVLAVLAAHPDQHVRADTLIDALWGSDPPPSADRTLRSYVSRLRAVVGSCIVASRGGFCLCTSDIRLDSSELNDVWPRPNCLRPLRRSMPYAPPSHCGTGPLSGS